MPPRILQSISVATLASSAIAVIAIGLYMAQPWGDNYAYQDVEGYGRLALLVLFAISPYLALLIFSWVFARYAGARSSLFAVGAAVIGVAGVAAYFDTAFIHTDAQGGLIFLFLPVIQLIACFLLVVGCALWLWLARSRGAAR